MINLKRNWLIEDLGLLRSPEQRRLPTSLRCEMGGKSMRRVFTKTKQVFPKMRSNLCRCSCQGQRHCDACSCDCLPKRGLWENDACGPFGGRSGKSGRGAGGSDRYRSAG